MILKRVFIKIKQKRKNSNMNILQKLLLTGLILNLLSGLSAQNGGTVPVPNDPAGDPSHMRIGYMDGNRVYLQFRNTTELGDCCDLGYPVAIWPNNYDGTKSHDGIWFDVGARVFIDTSNGNVIESVEEAASRTGLDTLYYVQTYTRESHDESEGSVKVQWGLQAVGGYKNVVSETPAMSDKPESWPTLGWPAVNSTGEDTLIYKDPETGEIAWNGRFGKNGPCSHQIGIAKV